MAKGKKKQAKMDFALEENSKSFLRNYLNTPSPVGFENSGQKVWIDYVKKYADKVITDPYGSAAAIINPEHPFRVVIEAHVDEISWFVNYVTDQGLIYLKRNGGVDQVSTV